MVRNTKFFRRSSVTYRTLSEGPTWSDLFPLCSLKKWKAAVNYLKTVAYMIKIVKFLVHIVSEHLLQATFLMFKTETVWGGDGPPVATSLSHVLNSSVAFDANFLTYFPFILSKILRKLSLLLFWGNIAMWANKVSIVSNLVGSLTRISSKF